MYLESIDDDNLNRELGEPVPLSLSLSTSILAY